MVQPHAQTFYLAETTEATVSKVDRLLERRGQKLSVELTEMSQENGGLHIRRSTHLQDCTPTEQLQSSFSFKLLPDLSCKRANGILRWLLALSFKRWRKVAERNVLASLKPCVSKDGLSKVLFSKVRNA